MGVTYKKIRSGLYDVFCDRKKHGLLVRQRHAWVFVPVFGRHVYFGNTRDEAVAPRFDFNAFVAYGSKLPPKAE